MHTITHTAFRRVLLLCLLLLLAVTPATAQDEDPLRRDPQALAQRLLGWDGTTALPSLPTLYEVGDTLTFEVGKRNSDTPTTITATLTGVTPEIYLWVEQGITYDSAQMQQLAQLLDSVIGQLRWRGTYLPTDQLYGTGGQVIDPFNLYPLPDADNDPHLSILFATDLTEERNATINPIDSLPVALQPSGYGNAHELIVINTSAFVGAALTNEVYINLILRGAFNLIFDYNYPDQPQWLRNALSYFAVLRFQEATVGINEVEDYLIAPETPLLTVPTLVTADQTLGGQLLWLTYLNQRYGDSVMLDLFSAEGSGMTPLDQTLTARDMTDPLTGAVVTSDDAFADFVLANGLNLNVGDSRYLHRMAQLNPGETANTQLFDTLPQIINGSAGPYSARYYAYQASQAQQLEIRLAAATVDRLNLPDHTEPNNHFYWSGRTANRDHTLTRVFDLRNTDSATLTYDAWYVLADHWNYGYVEVSTDGGNHWQIVPATSTSNANRNGAAYGPGYTGTSNPQGPRPFPAIGIQIANDNVTIVNVIPGGAGETAGLQVGDVMIGYDGTPWPGSPNVIALLDDYAPGETLNLLIQRGRIQMDVPVVLGASTTRIVQPAPLWQAESVDLSAYAGQEILLRFEYISLPGFWNEGIAIDNIALDEIDYTDDVESQSDWTLAGWEIVANEVPARFLLQAATLNPPVTPLRVHRLQQPDDQPSGTWQVALQEGEWLIVAISGMNADTVQNADFTLSIREAKE